MNRAVLVLVALCVAAAATPIVMLLVSASEGAVAVVELERRIAEIGTPSDAATLLALKLLVDMMESMRTTVHLQLSSALLMIAVEIILAWAILKLIAKVVHLTRNTETVILNMGWKATGEFAKRVSQGDTIEEARARALVAGDGRRGGDAELEAALDQVDDR